MIDVSAGLGTQANPAPLTRPEDVAATFTDGNDNTSTTKLDRFGAPIGVTDALLRTTTTERDGNSKAARSVAANGRVTEATYDERGNLLTLTEAVGDPLERTSSFEYEPVFNQATRIIDPAGSETTFAYDANGNLTGITDAALTQTVLAYADANCPGQVTSVTRALGLAEETTTTLAYDPATCNLTSMIDPLGNPSSLAYDSTGNVISATDALLRESRFVYDDLNRMTKSIDATNSDPAPACGLAGVTCFAYDAAGNLASLTDAGGNVTDFAYDERERVTERTDPLLNAETLSYDGNGNTRFSTDRKGQTIEFQYDLADRLVRKIIQPGQPEELVRDLGYDLMDNVTSVVDPDSILAFTYDLLDRPETTSTAGSPLQPAVTLTAGYDANNNRVSLDDPTGQSAFTYDALNRLTDIAAPGAQAFAISYDALSRRVGVSLPNGIDTSLTFDTASRLTDISHVQGAVTTVSDFAYGHDAVNNRTSLAQTRPVPVQTALAYGYDDLDRLTQATRPEVAAPDETFGYDSAGNRLNRDGQVVDSVFDAADRLIEDADFTYAYDLNGNLASKTAKAGGAATAYTWDAEDRLVRIDLPGGGFAEYRYDGLDRRIQKDANGAVTRYVYDGLAILLEYDGLNTLLARYTHGPTIDDPLMLERDLDSSGTFEPGERFFYHGDGLGSVTELSDSTGAVARTIVYDSYGQIAQDTGGIEQPFTYTGRELDAESGLYFYRARYYDPAAGRFLSQDPIGIRGGDVNAYRYALGNPVNFRDPLGLEAIVLGDPVDGSPSQATTGEIIFATTLTLAPLILAVEGGACLAGAAVGAFGAANGAIFGKLGAGSKEQNRRKTSGGGCEGSDGGPIFEAGETFLDIAGAIGLGAVSGCLTAGFGGSISGSSAGVAATAGAGLGFVKGFTGTPDTPGSL